MSAREEIIYLLKAALPFVLLGLWKHPAFLIPAALMILATLTSASRRWMMRMWQKLGHVLGKIVSPIFLSFLYYVGLTPLALLRRLTGGDPLQLQRPQDSTLKTVNLENKPESYEELW